MNAKINKNRSGILKMLASCSFPTLEARALWELRSRSAVCGYGNTWDKALYRGKQLWSKGSGGCGASRQQMESYTGSKLETVLWKRTHTQKSRGASWGTQMWTIATDFQDTSAAWRDRHSSQPGWEPQVTQSPPTSYRSSTLQYPELGNQGSIT